jgi:hypothetical protein
MTALYVSFGVLAIAFCISILVIAYVVEASERRTTNAYHECMRYLDSVNEEVGNLRARPPLERDVAHLSQRVSAVERMSSERVTQPAKPATKRRARR